MSGECSRVQVTPSARADLLFLIAQAQTSVLPGLAREPAIEQVLVYVDTLSRMGHQAAMIQGTWLSTDGHLPGPKTVDWFIRIQQDGVPEVFDVHGNNEAQIDRIAREGILERTTHAYLEALTVSSSWEEGDPELIAGFRAINQAQVPRHPGKTAIDQWTQRALSVLQARNLQAQTQLALASRPAPRL